MNVFLNTNHDLRSGWKIAAYLTTFLAIWVGTGTALSVFFANSNLEGTQLTLIALNELALFVPAIATLLLMVRFVDRRPLSAFGVGFLPNWWRHLMAGFALAAMMVLVLVLGSYAFGFVKIGWTGGQVPISTLIATLVILFVAAASEELVFRSFPLQVLSEGLGMWPGIIVWSSMFGLLHLRNPNVSWLGAANTVIAGMLLSIAYMKKRSLWLPYGIHVGWNVGLGFILGFPLSGVDLASLWTTGTAGSDTILGGTYGPEGGLLATFIFAVSALTVQKRKLR